MDLANLIILILLLLIVAIPVIISLRLAKSKTQRSTSPAPAGASKTPSGGGSSSGKNGVQNWIMPIGIAYLLIRGLFIIGRNYITIFDWIIIAILAFFAILSFWNGKNRWLSLVLIVAIGCIIWFNQYHIDSFKPQSANPKEQSAGQQEVAPTPVEEMPSTERVVVAGRKITLTGDGTYTVPAGRKSVCFTALGKIDGSEITDQTIDIIYDNEILTLSTLGSKCIVLPEIMNGSIRVDFFPNKYWGEEPVLSNMYKRYRSIPGGQGEWPVIRIGE